MALTMLIRGQNSSHLELSAACFTKANYGVNTNTTLSVNTPRGVLGGSVAGLSATQSYTAVPCTRALMPAGLFANDAAGAAFENAPALASNKVAVVKGLATVEVDVYETRNIANNADLVYAAGQKLYCSDNGFLTNEASTSQVVIGVVVKAPTTASPTLGVDMRI